MYPLLQMNRFISSSLTKNSKNLCFLYDLALNNDHYSTRDEIVENKLI